MTASLPVQKVKFHAPSLEEVASVLESGLTANFANVHVAVTQCPDLKNKPFYLAGSGLCGQPKIADVGGVPHLIPSVMREKKYNLEEVAQLAETPGGLLIGAGAGPAHIIGRNVEMMTNIQLENNNHPETNNTHICLISPQTDHYELKHYKTKECCLLMNLFISEGKPGNVLEVKVAHRTGKLNFMECMRMSLANHYGCQPVGLGGTFLIERGNVWIHVMPDFSEVPLNSDEEVDDWLRFYDMPAPLVCVGILVSHDPDLDLRMEHFHCFSDHGDGGHYHYDTTPEEVVYHGYFNVAEHLYRIDRPKLSHNFGRD